MSKKDYQLIASALHAAKLKIERIALSPDDQTPAIASWHLTVESVADVLERENNRFQRGTFLKACGVED
jgi:hypothetical protein